MIKVCKFGGTSMANAEALKQVKKIIESDKDRKYIVVSAPGKREKTDIKVTDLLFKVYDELKEKGNCKETFSIVRKRFTDIASDLKLDFDIEGLLNDTENEIVKQNSLDFTISRGEYLSAKLLSNYLGLKFVDASEIIRFDSTGKLNEDYTNDNVVLKISSLENAVIPGFYGKSYDGKIKAFSRGGSDISGSIIARGVSADLYENWTDVNGFLVCDPRIVPEAKTIKQITYKELRELSYMGASVLHPEAIFPVVKGKIKINIRNTFNPDNEGTMIVPNEQYKAEEGSVITGIAGKKNFTVLYVEKSMMNSEVGFIRRVLSIIEHHGLCVEHVPSGIDTLSIVIDTNQLKGDMLSDIVNAIRDTVNPDYVHVIENISLIATVGHGMARRTGTASAIFTALAKEGVNIKMIDQGSSELNIIIGVANADYEKCISAIYKTFN